MSPLLLLDQNGSFFRGFPMLSRQAGSMAAAPVVFFTEWSIFHWFSNGFGTWWGYGWSLFWSRGRQCLFGLCISYSLRTCGLRMLSFARYCQIREILPDTARCCQILLDTARYCQIRPDIARYCQILPDTARYGQILPDNARYCQILPHNGKYCQILPDIARYC